MAKKIEETRKCNPPVPAVYPSIRWDLIASPRLSDHFLPRPSVAFGVRHASPVLVSVEESKKKRCCYKQLQCGVFEWCFHISNSHRDLYMVIFLFSSWQFITFEGGGLTIWCVLICKQATSLHLGYASAKPSYGSKTPLWYCLVLWCDDDNKS